VRIAKVGMAGGSNSTKLVSAALGRPHRLATSLLPLSTRRTHTVTFYLQQPTSSSSRSLSLHAPRLLASMHPDHYLPFYTLVLA